MRLQGCFPNTTGKASTKKGAGRIQIGTPWRAAPVRDRDENHPSRKVPWRPNRGPAAEGPTAHSEVPSSVPLQASTIKRPFGAALGTGNLQLHKTNAGKRPWKSQREGELSQNGHSRVTATSIGYAKAAEAADECLAAMTPSIGPDRMSARAARRTRRPVSPRRAREVRHGAHRL